MVSSNGKQTKENEANGYSKLIRENRVRESRTLSTTEEHANDLCSVIYTSKRDNEHHLCTASVKLDWFQEHLIQLVCITANVPCR